MKRFKNILIASLILGSVSMIAFAAHQGFSSILAIFVFAGDDTTSCPSQSLTMSSLDATILGDVSNGDWITFGDGKFLPGNVSSIRYSAAVSYVPGPLDKSLGFYRLMLMSDVSGNNQRVTDEVKITFQAAPPLICSNNINISLDEKCELKIDITMLQPNPVMPYNNYLISLFEANGKLIPNNIVNKTHLDKEITYKVGHKCSSNICWGKFKVEDYFAPSFQCRRDTITCAKSGSPESVGFPIPVSTIITKVSENKYNVKNWDSCSVVALEYNDIIVKAACAKDEDRTITRKWVANDAKGNQSTCTQVIVVKRLPISTVVFPDHFNDVLKPSFECGDTFPTLANGHPSPDTTGFPLKGFCSNLEFQMNDAKFPKCGSGFKVVRAWFLIDWCSQESITRNQIIEVKDSRPPTFELIDTLELKTNPYKCNTSLTELPKATNILDCSGSTLKIELLDSQDNVLEANVIFQSNKYFLDEVPVGKYTLRYTYTDACNNSLDKEVILLVKDKTVPTPACNLSLKISLDNFGKARVFANSFDNNSTDNCGIAGFRIRKMDDKCGFGTKFGSFADFCCDEIGAIQMLAIEVTDIHGNQNTCMVQAEIEDKIKPLISCPPNITIACFDSYDLGNLDVYGKVVTNEANREDIIIHNFYHNGYAGRDGLANDNCSVSVSESVTTDITCFRGSILRKFVAKDKFGLKDSCFQTITILNPTPFSELDIKWPKNYESDGCKSTHASPNLTGKPEFSNTKCSNVAATYEDKPFYIADGACFKIIRTWTVIDWCQHTPSGQTGKWGPYIQIIKLHNNDKPTFTSPCKDTLVCSYDVSCKSALFRLDFNATDPCTDAKDLIWRYELDLNSDGNIDSIGSISAFEQTLPLGDHRLKWIVSDQCGNSSQCSQNIFVKDCKKPTPYCLTSLSLTLMQGSGSVSVWAKDFNLDSYDNCTPKDSLIYTFNDAKPVSNRLKVEHYFEENGLLSSLSRYEEGKAQIWIPSTRSSGLLFDCADIPNGKSAFIPLSMSVTDGNGNIDFCQVTLNLQDSNKICPDLVTTSLVSGKVATTIAKVPAELIVNVEGTETSQVLKVDTSTGRFLSEPLLINKTYNIAPYLNSDATIGISTLDLVMIQRHILGMVSLGSPYKIIAADVNKSSSLSIADLVELRRLMLGITSSFSNNITSWTFVPRSFVFIDPKRPYDYPNFIAHTTEIQDKDDLDFYAIKLGDVNDTAVPLTDDVSVRSKNEYPVQISIENRFDGDYLNIVSLESCSLQAFSLNLQYLNAINHFDNDASETILSESETFVDHNHVRTIAYQQDFDAIEKGQLLFSVKIVDGIDLEKITLGSGLESSILTEDGERPLKLKIIDRPTTSDLAYNKYKLKSNPVKNYLNIQTLEWSSNVKLNYEIYTSAGQLLQNGNISIADDVNEFIIPIDQNIQSGVYFLRITDEKSTATLKFIKSNR